MSNVIVISTSLRPESNSAALAREFARGAADAGHNVEFVSLRNKKIAFCLGCMSCYESRRCVIDDDAIAIREQVYNADAVCFATPIYYYEMSGQMKTLLDRMNSLYDSDYRFRDIYMLSSATEDLPEVPKRAEAGLTGWVDCFERADLAGTLFAGGVTDQGDIRGHKALEEAYRLGRSVK